MAANSGEIDSDEEIWMTIRHLDPDRGQEERHRTRRDVGIERTILGLHAKYNDVANWHHADLPRVFSRREVASHVVATSKKLSEGLRTVDDSFTFVELLMKPDDAPLGLIRGGHASANLDYGPRGPQSAPGAQIQIPQS